MKKIKDYEGLAQQVIEHMRTELCVRLDANTVGRYITVYELADALDFYIGDWPEIKTTILASGHHIVFAPGKGHYLGYAGEDAYNAYFTGRMVTGWENRTRRYLDAMSDHRKEQADYIKEKFNVDWDEFTRRYK